MRTVPRVLETICIVLSRLRRHMLRRRRTTDASLWRAGLIVPHGRSEGSISARAAGSELMLTGIKLVTGRK